MVLLMNNLKNVYGKLNNITCVVGLMLGEIHKKQQSQKCDQEPIFKFILVMFADKEDPVCKVKVSIPMGPLDKYC